MILLDDVESTAALPTSRLYRNPSQYWAAKEITEIASCLAAIESATQQGLYVVAAFAYELGHYLQGMPLDLSVAWAMACAELTLSSTFANSPLLSVAAVKARLEEQ